MLLLRGAAGRLARGCALAALATVACAHKTTASREATTATWTTAARVEQRQRASAEKQTATRRTTRTVTRRPSGEVIDQTLIEEIAEVASQRSVVTGRGSASAAGRAETTREERRETKPRGFPWATVLGWVVSLAVVGAGAWWVWRKVRRRIL